MFNTCCSSCFPELMQELHAPVASLLAKHKGTSASGIQHLERDVFNLAGESGHRGAGKLPCPGLWVRTHHWQCWCSSPRLIPARQGGAFSSQAVISGAVGFALGSCSLPTAPEEVVVPQSS